ncbi:AraC family transcriptional regulator [Paenibacillus psychroresistens]|uniref:AraC family transcriptional regulator n=1 Tax=Paenibacillus psychroresistens TaxID=1778678 RepID=A0A6B8RG12_9BACL|nr:AraC family transcriptional regulator [Paenibacillus psychroresistens]QGQ95049.1 AraC family transcriptional regulator [Paenibacillus psychroresistens]
MKPSKETLKEDIFIKDQLLLYVNRATETFHMPLHSHEFIELAYVAEGKGFHYIENEVQRIHKGQLHVIPIGVSHVFRPNSTDALKDPLIVYNCIFTRKLIDSLIPFITDKAIAEYLAGLSEETLPYYALLDADGAVEKLFLALYREYSLPISGSSTFLNTLLIQLIVTLYRLKNDKIETSSNKPARFLQVLHYMDQQFAEEITLSHLTDRFQWSERHLQRLFKQHTEQTFNHYLQNLRITKSCELLRSSQLSVSRVAESVGYKDIHSFNVLFKRIVGNTPSSYRGQIK